MEREESCFPLLAFSFKVRETQWLVVDLSGGRDAEIEVFEASDTLMLKALVNALKI